MASESASVNFEEARRRNEGRKLPNVGRPSRGHGRQTTRRPILGIGAVTQASCLLSRPTYTRLFRVSLKLEKNFTTSFDPSAMSHTTSSPILSLSRYYISWCIPISLVDTFCLYMSYTLSYYLVECIIFTRNMNRRLHSISPATATR
jgi:hypothetical protein